MGSRRMASDALKVPLLGILLQLISTKAISGCTESCLQGLETCSSVNIRHPSAGIKMEGVRVERVEIGLPTGCVSSLRFTYTDEAKKDWSFCLEKDENIDFLLSTKQDGSCNQHLESFNDKVTISPST